MTSIGEVITMRTLRREERDGVPHFLTGQHGARLLTPGYAQLSYVDNSGHLVVMPCAADARGEWYPMGGVLRCGVVSCGFHSVPLGFELSPRMIAAIKRAESRR